jgi:HK97 family phage major capsid protein
MENEIKTKAEQLAAECAAAKAEAAAATKAAEELRKDVEAKTATIDEQKQSIDNLDKSVKEQKSALEALRKQLSERPTDLKRAIRDAFYANESAIRDFVKKAADKFDVTLELKEAASITTASIVPNNFLGIAVDPTIHAAVPEANAFLIEFGIRPRTANKLGWIEASTESGADYIAELAENKNKSGVNFVEKSRGFAKIGTYITISTEMEDWFEQLHNYCVNEGVRLIEAKLDAEIYSGAGSDAATGKVYGIKSSATPFAALAAKSIENANIADVIFDAADQIRKAGYHANVAFVTWPEYRQLKSLKDKNGNYIFDQVNGMLDGVRIRTSDRLADGEILVCDSSCVEVYGGSSYELEFERNASVDGYTVYFRKAAQTKVPTPKKKGLVYVASVTTAIAALQVETA